MDLNVNYNAQSSLITRQAVSACGANERQQLCSPSVQSAPKKQEIKCRTSQLNDLDDWQGLSETVKEECIIVLPSQNQVPDFVNFPQCNPSVPEASKTFLIVICLAFLFFRRMKGQKTAKNTKSQP